VNAAVKPLEGTKPDGQIMCEVLQRFGFPQADYTPDGVLAEIAAIVPFFKGITWANLDINGKQWPVQEGGVDTQIMHQSSSSVAKATSITSTGRSPPSSRPTEPSSPSSSPPAASWSTTTAAP
jgi:predicted molibdopterin-dependent oxidoreductase YjgC